MSGPADAKLEYLEVFGARGTTSPNEGIGIQCRVPGFAPKLALVDVLVRMSARQAVDGGGCAFTASRSSFVDNVGSGISLTDGTANIDRCSAVGNTSTGFALDGGIYVITNSIIARNAYRGLDVYSTNNGNRVEFNTIVDNGDPSFGTGVYCNLQGNGTALFDSNIIARNATTQTEPPNSPCVYTNSIIIDTDITPLKFKRADTAPYDYHIQSGSTAVDAGSTTTTLTLDIDGETRPFGSSSDVGADELH